MRANIVSTTLLLSALASANAQYYNNLYDRDIETNYFDLSERDVSDLSWNALTTRDLAQLSRRDLEELAARDPNFKSFMKKIGKGIKNGAKKVGEGLKKIVPAIGKEAIKDAPQLMKAAATMARRDEVEVGIDVYARSLEQLSERDTEELAVREAEADFDDYLGFDLYAREAEEDGENFVISAREAYTDPEIFDYEF